MGDMKALLVAATVALLGLSNESSAATLDFHIDATSQTQGGVTDVIFHFSVISDDGSVTFTPTGGFVSLGIGQPSFSVAVPPTSPAFVTSYIYPDAGTYTVSATLSGYFSDDPNLYDFNSDAVVSITQVSGVPIPAAFPLFATALGGLGWLACKRRKENPGIRHLSLVPMAS
jgi:hypothetical protein